MIFCSTDLAARIEQAERDLVASACAHMRARCADPFLIEFGGGFIAFTEPGSPMNKVVGLGFAPFDQAAWPAVEEEHARRAAAVQVELSTLADPAIGKFLTGRGYELVAVENVSGRALSRDVVASPTSVTIEVCPAVQLERWIDVLVTGFAAPDAAGVGVHEAFDRAVIERIIHDFAKARGVQLFLAHRDGQLAGGASMRLDGSIAQLCGAATLPGHRRRGVQSALLAHRLAIAAQSGCELAIVTTQPGSKSQQNMHRQGFELLYSRNVLVKAPS